MRQWAKKFLRINLCLSIYLQFIVYSGVYGWMKREQSIFVYLELPSSFQNLNNLRYLHFYAFMKKGI